MNAALRRALQLVTLRWDSDSIKQTIHKVFLRLTAVLYVMHQPLRWHCFKPAQLFPYYAREALSRRSHMGKGERIPHALSDLFRYRLAAS